MTPGGSRWMMSMCARSLAVPASSLNSNERLTGSLPASRGACRSSASRASVSRGCSQELCRRGEDRRYLVLEGRAAEFERDIPFGLIVNALNDYFGSLEPVVLRALDEDVPRELAEIFPALPREPDSGASRGEGAERYRLHYAVRSVLERLASRQPLVLALDDVHWADAASVEMLAHLLRRFRGPALMAVAYRQRVVAAARRARGRRPRRPREPPGAGAAHGRGGRAADRSGGR